MRTCHPRPSSLSRRLLFLACASSSRVDSSPRTSLSSPLPTLAPPLPSPPLPTLSTPAPSLHSPLPPLSASLPRPSLSIVILVVGTRGDVQPFCALASRLQADGHRVRLATHPEFRALVEACGVDFFPLAGEPKLLSSWMVESEGRVVPNFFSRRERRTILPKVRMVRQITRSTWPACTQPSPRGAFVADAIISNPVSYGHIHCAEALGVPLHMMFPQPWSPTSAFPHPYSIFHPSSIARKPTSRRVRARTRAHALINRFTFRYIDAIMWVALATNINSFRRSLGLRPLRVTDNPANLINSLHVPFVKMWSPALCPKPADWGEHIDVVGHFFAGEPIPSSLPGARREGGLAAFLRDGPPPVFVGFGSMVVSSPAKLVAAIVTAAREAGVRILLQSGFTDWSEELQRIREREGEGSTENVFVLGNCPHDWLFPRVAACVHHGGAGTVAASLRAGRPTLVCPFFGDQHLWGAMVHRCGAGPSPIPIKRLSASNLAAAFRALQDPLTLRGAARQAAAYAHEDGVGAAASAFYRQLPLERMVCEVGLLMGEAAVGAFIVEPLGVRISAEVHEVLSSSFSSDAPLTFTACSPAIAKGLVALPPHTTAASPARRLEIQKAFTLACRAHHSFARLAAGFTTEGRVASRLRPADMPERTPRRPKRSAARRKKSKSKLQGIAISTLQRLVSTAEARGCRSLDVPLAFSLLDELLQHGSRRPRLAVTEWCHFLARLRSSHAAAAADAAVDELLAPVCSERSLDALLCAPFQSHGGRRRTESERARGERGVNPGVASTVC
ncbi:hypothetical protein AB1Y20_010344 [Prymnesium parvum]|uniref:Glycosyltransferase family 28 N-terminal domain-containing protein n=1 Tax=Prymnesium parvum TaxID=97485 RepID=A0AB34K526_PRYPA